MGITSNENNKSKIADYQISKKLGINGQFQSSKYENIKELYKGTGISFKNMDDARNCRVRRLNRPNSSY